MHLQRLISVGIRAEDSVEFANIVLMSHTILPHEKIPFGRDLFCYQTCDVEL